MPDIEKLRGTTCAVGTVEFVFPGSPPESKEEVLVLEETVAMLKDEIAQPSKLVREGRHLIHALGDEISSFWRQKQEEEASGEKQEQIPMDREPVKPPRRRHRKKR